MHIESNRVKQNKAGGASEEESERGQEQLINVWISGSGGKKQGKDDNRQEKSS